MSPGWKIRPAAPACCLWAILCVVSGGAHAEERESFGRFGEVVLYRNEPHPAHVVLFVSGDGGWNQGVVDMAKALASMDAMVVGIDVRTYLAVLHRSHDSCLYPASDFEALSQFLQKKLGFPSYREPVLAGYSSGATLVYAVLAQAPSDTFRGGMSLGFCPDLAASRPFCKGSGLSSKTNAEGTAVVFEPIPEIASPWIVFQGTIDQVCDASAAERYVDRVGGAEIVLLPKVGHGFSVQKNWLPQVRDAFRRLVQGDRGVVSPSSAPGSDATGSVSGGLDPSVGDLPLVEVPAPAGRSDALAFVASGDGGWAGLDKQVAGRLAAKGVPVVGLDTLRYYWQPRTPEESGRALERILRHYLVKWKKERLLLVGYSRGADVLPFMVSRLPEDLAARVDLIVLLGPAPRVTFEFRYTDWIRAPDADAVPVEPEIEKLRGHKLLCVYGADETDSLCPQLPGGLALLDERPGGHHFGGDYQAVADRILREARR